LQLQDEDRRRMARDLHDSLGQDLAGMKLELAALSREAEKLDPELAVKISEIAQTARHISDQVRTISYLLHPPLLDDLGLGSALRWFVEGFEKRSGIRTRLETNIDGQRLPSELETTVFRTVQEALTNIHRHAESPTAAIGLHRFPDHLVLEIEDEGTGMTPDQLAHITSGMTTSVGLPGMRERIRQFRGDWQVFSGKRGLKIKATIPLRENPRPEGG
jgi:two-component system, NarL family, sensor kinase